MPRPAPPIPTIGELMRGGPGWLWAWCALPCQHRRPVALARFAILWGMDASSDTIRDRLRCDACGQIGCTLTRPSVGPFGAEASWPEQSC